MMRWRHVDDGAQEIATNAETRELVVTSIHPGVSREQIIEATGWAIRFAATLDTTAEPNATELQILRELKARTERHHAGEQEV